jgi:C-terminal processing protease CtpA/Prc
MKLRRFGGIALALVGIACADVVGPAAATDYGSLFDDLWRQFDLHYSYFAIANVNWDSVGAYYRPIAVSAPNDYQFSRVLGTMLAQLKDMHVSLSPGKAGNTMRYVSRFDTTSTFFNQTQTLSRYVRIPASTTSGNIQFGLTADSVGYARIASFDGGDWARDIDAAIQGMPTMRALIIDVRDNPGGNYVLAAAIAGRFTDQRRVYGYTRRRNGPQHDDFTGYHEETIQPAGTHYAGRVVVLANRHSCSSAEDFVLAMRSIPGVMTVGDTTAGASGGPIVRELANGWTYELSEWIEYTPEKTTFEAVGLAPMVYARTTADQAARGVDGVLETALQLARQR